MIILMGVAGSGKSLQGRLMADEHGYAWISTGEILRVLVTGKRRQEMLAGKLLSDEEMVTLMDKVFELIDTMQEFVLDGFPRTIPQLNWLLEQQKKHRFDLHTVFNLVASEEVLLERLTKRGRPDDNEKAIKERFTEYNNVSKPIMDNLRKSGIKIIDIDASQNPRAVHDQILQYLDKIQKA